MKPFKGVISDWYRDGAAVVGKCAWHPAALAAVTPEAVFKNLIVLGEEIHTSRVERIEDRGAFSICETRNSFYVLTNQRRIDERRSKSTMSIPLTRELLERSYDLLRSSPPFRGWNMPEAEDVLFRVYRHPMLRGEYYRERGRHVIRISSRCHSQISTLLKTMAHEMIHLYQGDVGMETKSQHNEAFVRLAAKVCRIHGWDPKDFW